MNILMVLSNPYMVDGRVQNETKVLTETGHHVSIIVWDRKQEYPVVDTVDEIDIYRVHMRGLGSVVLNNLLWWNKAYHIASQLDVDVVHCHDLDILPVGVWLKKQKGIPLIYDAHEIFGNMIARDMPKLLVKTVFILEKWLIQYVDRIVTVNKPLENYFKSISDKPITVVMNVKEPYCDSYVSPDNTMFTVVYIGVVTSSRMFPDIIDILGGLSDVCFVVAAKKENLYDIVEERCMQYDNVRFLGSIPFSDVLPQTFAADVVVCMIDPADKNNSIGLANKQFEAMACGRPLITTCGTLVGEITERFNCGLVIGYDARCLVDAVNLLKDDRERCIELGMNALSAAVNVFNWMVEKKKLLEVYDGYSIKV